MASAGSLINATNLLRVGVGPQSEAWHGLVERWLIALPLKFGLICARRPDLSISMQRNVGNRESAAREVGTQGIRLTGRQLFLFSLLPSAMDSLTGGACSCNPIRYRVDEVREKRCQ